MEQIEILVLNFQKLNLQIRTSFSFFLSATSRRVAAVVLHWMHAFYVPTSAAFAKLRTYLFRTKKLDLWLPMLRNIRNNWITCQLFMNCMYDNQFQIHRFLALQKCKVWNNKSFPHQGLDDYSLPLLFKGTVANALNKYVNSICFGHSPLTVFH